MAENVDASVSKVEQAQRLLDEATTLLGEVGLRCLVIIEPTSHRATPEYRPVYSQPHMAPDGRLNLAQGARFTAYKLDTPEPEVTPLPLPEDS